MLERVYTMFGEANGGKQTGYSVAPAGDFNGDGYDDVLVVAPGYYQHFSITYTCGLGGNCSAAFSPSTHPVPTGIEVCATDADASFSGASSNNSAGTPDNSAGRTMMGGADLTGDGSIDILVCAPAQEWFAQTIHGPGHVYVVEGDEPVRSVWGRRRR